MHQLHKLHGRLPVAVPMWQPDASAIHVPVTHVPVTQAVRCNAYHQVSFTVHAKKEAKQPECHAPLVQIR